MTKSSMTKPTKIRGRGVAVKNPHDAQRGSDPDLSKLEGQSKAEIEALRAKYTAIKEGDKHALELLRDSGDTEFWICIVFQNRPMKDEFLEKTKLGKIGNKYLNGLRVAKTLGIELKTPVPKIRKHVTSKKLAEFVD